MSILLGENLVVYRGGRPVLHGINLSLRTDEAVALIGPNGVGKTSLLLALQGLLPLAAGHVRLDGRDVHAMPPRRRAMFAAYAPQSLERIADLTVSEVVAGGRYSHRSLLAAPSQADRAAVQEALERCGLTRLADRSLRRVSAGERQKALLAAALAQDAQTLFLDEPTAALDPAYQIELVQILRDWRARGRGVVAVSHDLHFPAAVAQRVIALKDGRIAADGPCAAVLSPTTLEAVFGAEFETFRGAGNNPVVLPRY